MATRAELAKMQGVLYQEALLLVVKDEINLLRAQHSLPARTNEQVIDAMVAKIGTLTKHSHQNTADKYVEP